MSVAFYDFNFSGERKILRLDSFYAFNDNFLDFRNSTVMLLCFLAGFLFQKTCLFLLFIHDFSCSHAYSQ